MKNRYLLSTLLFLVVTASATSEFLRIPLVNGFFYDLELEIGTPAIKQKTGTTLMMNNLVVECSD